MGAEFILSVISTLSGLLSTLRSSGATSTEGGNYIERDLDRLERLLKRIQATLYDAGEREIQDESVKLWLKEIKTVAYEAEDILDECQYELLRRQIEESEEATSSSSEAEDDRMMKNMKRSKGVISDQMAEKIKGLLDRFDEISRDRGALSLREDDGERRDRVWTGLLPTSHMVNETAVFGRDEDKRRILDLVLSGNIKEKHHISVVSIVGMGGVGKTTLAQLVYNNPLIRGYFDMSAWVYVSPQFDVTRISKEVLESISEVYRGLTGLSAVQCDIEKAIKGKKLFLVLDDVWNELASKWEKFVEPLRVAESVRIVVTTRLKDVGVAQIIQTTHIYDLSCLPQYQCELLFEHYAFGGQIVDGSSRLREIGALIIKKCAGLPLAIKSIARSLSCNMHEYSWRDVLGSELWESDGIDEIFPALKVSYYSLPPELKPCLLFCSLFPKGYRFLKDDIIYMWIAHGYVQTRGRKSEEDIGDEYIHELDSRSFLMLDKQRGEETFTLHDLIHDLARSISMGEFCTNATGSINGVISSETHHVYTENCSMIERSSGNNLFGRTLVNCCKSDSLFMVRQNNLKLCTNYPNLRVLKCEGAYASALEDMVNLKHLRYFELSSNNLERLPKSTTLLFNLVALRIRFLWYLKELPVHIGKLVNLRSLSITDVGIKELPESLGQLSNLQMLYLCSCSQIKEWPICIGNLTNLKKLQISDAKFTELPESFCMLNKLQTLVLKRCWNILRLPDGIGNLINLQCIYVLDSWLESLPKSINQLCNLDMLELSTRASLVGLLCNLEGILNRSSLNISIKKQQVSNLKKKEKQQVKGNFKKQQVERNFGLYKYRKTESLLECLKPLNDLVEFKVNGIEGIGFPKWISANYNSGVAISMQCHLNSRKFFRDLGELPSLKSLTLIGQTLGNNFHQTLTTQDVMMIFPSLKELEFNDMIELNLLVGELDWVFPVLHTLRINNCSNLSSLPKFGSLKRLEITKCSFSKLEFNRLHLQLLEKLIIKECIQLTSLHGLESLYSLQILYVVQCPQWNILVGETYEFRELLWSSLKNVSSQYDMPTKKDHHLASPWGCPVLHSLIINDCPNLSSVPKFDSLKRLEIIKCSFSKLDFNRLHLQLLEDLQIEECIQLTSLHGLESLYSLQILYVVRCPQWNILVGEEDWGCPVLHSLIINDCPNLSSVPTFDSLGRLEIIKCSFLKLEFNGWHLQLLEILHIKECIHLTSLHGLQSLCSLRYLYVKQCPQLMEFPYPMTTTIDIVECPSLKWWCQIKKLNYREDKNTIQRPSQENWRGKKNPLAFRVQVQVKERAQDPVLSSWSQIIERESEYTPEFPPAHPMIENSIKKSLEFHTDFYNLEKLEIKRCQKLETLKGLSELRSLRRLVLWDCPLLLLEEVPPFLMSLVIHGSHNMLSLDLLRGGNSSSLTELEITNCKRLMRLAGLRNLIKLETLAIMDCPQLLLELLFTVPDCVVISGCPRLKAWCEMHSIEPLDDEME